VKSIRRILAVSAVALLAAACGPAGTGADDDGTVGDDDGTSGTCTPSGAEGSVASCGNGMDDECDGLTDCEDPDCSGVGACPVCGEVDTSAGGGIVLPDGVTGTDCTSNADCGAATPNCIENTCHDSYTSTLDVIGFGPNQMFDNVDIIESVCVTMEHSWLRDMEIRLIAPGGQIVRMQRFLGQMGGEVYLGDANDCDESSPAPGTGAMYCWAPTATNPPMLDYANAGSAMNNVDSCDGFPADQLPPGTYSAADPWNLLMGSPLNGSWKFVVTDLWEIDNGFLFDWQIKFNPNSVADCSGPIIN